MVSFFSWSNGAMRLNPDGGYLTSMHPIDLGHLIASGNYSSEVATINMLRDKYYGTTKDFVDIGANVGTYSLVLGHVFQHTYAFEPSKHIHNILCGNVAIQELSDKVDTFNIGLYNKKTNLVFHFTDAVGSNNFFETDDEDTNKSLAWSLTSGQTKVPVTTLDAYNLTNVGLIKIDTEGTELQVLQGARKTIERNNYPELIFESWNPEERTQVTGTPIEDLQALRKELFDYIEAMGYKITHLENDVFSAEHKHIQ